jgi:transposase
MEPRSMLVSCRIANAGKIKKFQEVDNFAKDLKNSMSKYMHENLWLMIGDTYSFNKTYSKFNDDKMFAWEIQTMFHDIVELYKNRIDQLKERIDTSVQTGVKTTLYKKKTHIKGNITKEKGDVKSYTITKKYSEIGKLVKLLLFLDATNLNQYQGQKFYEFIQKYQAKPIWDRILKTVNQMKFHLMEKVKIIEFSTGTHRVNLKSDEFVLDETNSKFKHWFKYEDKFYPLQINDKYHGDLSQIKTIKNKQVTVKVVDERVDFIFTRDYEPTFKPESKIVGIDINIKNNFCTTSERETFDYDRTYVKEFIEEIKKLDKVGYQNITNDQKQHLEYLVNKNEWYFKSLVSEVLNKLDKDGVSDIVMEDFDNNSFKSMSTTNMEFDEKYTRLIRLLRLGNIKKWMKEQAEKKGIRVHFTPAPYTSQQCPNPNCGHIDHANRPTQEKFKCTECGHEDVADFVSPINIKNRFVSNVLREKLHKTDDFGRLIPIKMSRERLKGILSSFSSS